MNKVWLFISAIAWLSCSTSLWASDEVAKKCLYESSDKCIYDFSDRDSISEAFLTDQNAAIKIDLHLDNSKIRRTNGYWGSAENSNVITRFLSAIEIRWGEEKLYIPASSYSDLAYINNVEIYNISDGFHLLIRGGDASSSYTAVLAILNGRVAWRRVTGSSYPEIVWETTTYSSF